jgi:hypothetical protein
MHWPKLSEPANHEKLAFMLRVLPRSLALVTLLATVFLSSCIFESPRSTAFQASDTKPAADESLLLDYAAACEVELGKPGFPIEIPALDCQSPDMKNIDTLIDDADHLPAQAKTATGHNRCRAPSALLGTYPFTRDALDDPCQMGSRIGRADDGDVTWVTVCRKYRQHKDPNLFDDVNMIGFNRVTGKTCFFNSQVTGDSIDKPLSFDEPKTVKAHGTSIFMSPNQIQGIVPCGNCHSANAFLRSPHISKAVDLPPISKDTPYEIVWSQYFLPGGLAAKNLRLDPTMAPSIKQCVSCHAVGLGRYCSALIPMAWGSLAPELTHSHFVSTGNEGSRPHLWHQGVIPKLNKINAAENPNTVAVHSYSAAVEQILLACSNLPDNNRKDKEKETNQSIKEPKP